MIWGVVDRVRVVAGSVGKDGLYMQSLFELKAVITADELTQGSSSAYYYVAMCSGQSACGP